MHNSIPTETRNATRCNDWNDLPHLSFTVKNSNSKFGDLHITQPNIFEGVFIAKIVIREYIHKKASS